jgi:hypothetical protein
MDDQSLGFVLTSLVPVLRSNVDCYGFLDAIGRAVTRQRLATRLSVGINQNLTSTSDVFQNLASEDEPLQALSSPHGSPLSQAWRLS